MQAHRDRAHRLRVVRAQEQNGAVIDRGDADVHEVDLRLVGKSAGDVLLEADPQADESLSEQLALLLLLERAVELVVREEPLAQEKRAQMRAGLVVEKLMVEACRPHWLAYRVSGRPA